MCWLKYELRVVVSSAVGCVLYTATTVVPGSHKSLLLHPRVHSTQTGEGNMRVDGATLEGATEVHLKAGDAVSLHVCQGGLAL